LPDRQVDRQRGGRDEPARESGAGNRVFTIEDGEHAARGERKVRSATILPPDGQRVQNVLSVRAVE